MHGVPPAAAHIAPFPPPSSCSVAGNLTSLLALDTADLEMGTVTVAGCQQVVKVRCRQPTFLTSA